MKGFIVISAKLIGYNSILAQIISKNSKKIRMQNLRKNTLQQSLMFKWSVKPQANIKYLKALQMKGFIVISAKLIGCKKGLARLISLV